MHTLHICIIACGHIKAIISLEGIILILLLKCTYRDRINNENALLLY